jgi:hypothetical protein
MKIGMPIGILSKPSGFQGLGPFLASFCAFSFLFHRGLFIETSRLDLFEQTINLNFAFQSFDCFFYIIADYFNLYNSLSPASPIT